MLAHHILYLEAFRCVSHYHVFNLQKSSALTFYGSNAAQIVSRNFRTLGSSQLELIPSTHAITYHSSSKYKNSGSTRSMRGRKLHTSNYSFTSELPTSNSSSQPPKQSKAFKTYLKTISSLESSSNANNNSAEAISKVEAELNRLGRFVGKKPQQTPLFVIGTQYQTLYNQLISDINSIQGVKITKPSQYQSSTFLSFVEHFPSIKDASMLPHQETLRYKLSSVNSIPTKIQNLISSILNPNISSIGHHHGKKLQELHDITFFEWTQCIDSIIQRDITPESFIQIHRILNICDLTPHTLRIKLYTSQNIASKLPHFAQTLMNDVLKSKNKIGDDKKPLCPRTELGLAMIAVLAHTVPFPLFIDCLLAILKNLSTVKSKKSEQERCTELALIRYYIADACIKHSNSRYTLEFLTVPSNDAPENVWKAFENSLESVAEFCSSHAHSLELKKILGMISEIPRINQHAHWRRKQYEWILQATLAEHFPADRDASKHSPRKIHPSQVHTFLHFMKEQCGVSSKACNISLKILSRIDSSSTPRQVLKHLVENYKCPTDLETYLILATTGQEPNMPIPANPQRAQQLFKEIAESIDRYEPTSDVYSLVLQYFQHPPFLKSSQNALKVLFESSMNSSTSLITSDMLSSSMDAYNRHLLWDESIQIFERVLRSKECQIQMNHLKYYFCALNHHSTEPFKRVLSLLKMMKSGAISRLPGVTQSSRQEAIQKQITLIFDVKLEASKSFQPFNPLGHIQPDSGLFEFAWLCIRRSKSLMQMAHSHPYFLQCRIIFYQRIVESLFMFEKYLTLSECLVEMVKFCDWNLIAPLIYTTLKQLFLKKKGNIIILVIEQMEAKGASLEPVSDIVESMISMRKQ